jgi:transcriptional regulator with XRE-family HTH domain
MNTQTRDLRELRLSKGLSQNDLAEKSGVAQSYISDWETGRHIPTPASTRKIAEALEVEVEVVFDACQETARRSKVETNA